MSVEEEQRRTSQIVAAYVRKNLIPTDQIAALINSVHSTLSGLGNEIVEEPPRVPAVSIRRSVHADYVICIECGFKGQMIKRHLQLRHGLSIAQYKTRWKLPSDYSTTAPNYSEHRSQLAKIIGLGRGRAQPEALHGATTASATEKPTRRRAASKTTKTRTTATKASSKGSVKKASGRSRKPSSKVASKAATGPEGATA
jgi:predicted transcriptional regulator